jgi:uncharacterized protein (DUF58 family)
VNGRAAAFFLAGLTALAAALSTGSPLYYLIALMMGLMLLYASVSAIWTLYTASAKADCPRRVVTRGQEIQLTVLVKHLCPLPVRSLELLLAVPGDQDASGSVEIAPRPFAFVQYEAAFRCPHRGSYQVGVMRLTVTDLFGLVTLSRKAGGQMARVEVRPRVSSEEPMALQSVETGAEHISRMTEDAASPSGVRDWIPGDALKKVHWKLTMRKRELMVRTYEESARPDTLLLVDLTPLGAFRSHAMSTEDAICEAAASAAIAQLKAGYPVRMPLSAKEPQEVSGQTAAEAGRFIDALMRVQFDSPYPYEQLLSMEMRRMSRTGGAVLVTSVLSARIADIATQFRRSGMQVKVYWVTDTQRTEALEMLTRLKLSGVRARQIDPWAENLAI